MTKARILLADNDLEFLQATVLRLKKEGYEVFEATTPQEVSQIVRDLHVDVIVLDIRLANDLDTDDLSGIELAETLNPALPKIIYTTFPSYQLVRKALGRSIEGVPPALDFVTKLEGSQALLESIVRAQGQAPWLKKAAARAQIGRASRMPDFEFRELMSFRDWAKKLMRPPYSEREIDLWVSEMELLIAKLLYDAESILIDNVDSPLRSEARAWVRSQGGMSQSSRGLLRVWTLEHMLKERSASSTPLARQLGDWVLKSDNNDWEVSEHFGATVYLGFDPDKEPYLWLTEYVHQQKSRNICKTVTDLLRKALNGLYFRAVEPSTDSTLAVSYARIVGLEHLIASPESLLAKTHDIMRRIQLVFHVTCKLNERTGAISFHFGDKVTLQGLSPMSVLQHATSLGASIPVLRRLSIGNMDGYNVLVDVNGNTKLTDLASIAERPSLSDLVALEASFRFDWAEAITARELLGSLSTLLEFPGNSEQSSTTRGTTEPSNQEPFEHYQVVRIIREFACELQDYSRSDYCLGLFFHAANRFIRSNESDTQVHALAAASVLALEILGDNFDGVFLTKRE